MESDEFLTGKLKSLHEKIRQHELVKRGSSRQQLEKMISSQKIGLGAIRASLDDIELGISKSNFNLDFKRESISTISTAKGESKPEKSLPPYIKITLRRTADILLYEQRSATADRDSEEGKRVEADNKLYEYLTEGKGQVRTRFNAVSQTTNVLYKSRSVNTETILKDHVGSYVSNFEMFDTYKDMEKSTKSVDMAGEKKMQITTYKVHGVDEFIEISEKENFELALMLTMRILAGNVYEMQQRRFRNMIEADALATEVKYKYRLESLWRYEPQLVDNVPVAVCDLSWCPDNGDILAAAYGIYSYSSENLPSKGSICIWNIKNPVNPERSFHFNVPVVTVEFSTFVPQLLAVGLYNGSVEVRDITNTNDPPVAISERSTSPGNEPVIAIKWIPKSSEDSKDIERFLALSQDGSVTKYRIINSTYLLGYQQIKLDRVEGSPEGLSVERLSEPMQANRHPQGLNLALNPLQKDIYYVLTDEGCRHKCSTNYPRQHLEVSQLHAAAINTMEFSPWSPKLFLTCGNDWSIHIWMEGIFKPIITLKYGDVPIHCASWSKTHSTIVVSLTRKTIDIWDIRRSTLKPLSSTAIDQSFYTLFRLSNCGRSLAVGNENGHILMLAFEDMPFPAYFQYEELELAIFKAISTNYQLTKDLKSIGFFGYPEEQQRKRRHKSKNN